MEKILIIDDDINLCKVLSEDLSEIGYQTTYFDNADDGFKYIKSDAEIDLILLDLKMPGKDGIQLLKEIRDEGIKTKVIILTAYADVRSAIDSAKFGANDFINKPYDIDELISTMRRVLNKEDYEN